MLLSNILKLLEILTSIFLLIIIINHCSWYGYSYKIINNTNESNIFKKIFGLNSITCDDDNSNYGKIVRNVINTGILINIISIILRFFKTTKILSDYLKITGLFLLCMGIFSMLLFKLKGELFIDFKNIDEINGELYGGYWIGFVSTICLVVYNILMSKSVIVLFT